MYIEIFREKYEVVFLLYEGLGISTLLNPFLSALI